MACVCELTAEPRVFPDNIAFVLVDDRSNAVPIKENCLAGKKVLRSKPIAQIKVFVKNGVDEAILLEWFVSELDYGTNSFTISLPFFGITRDWNVRIDLDEFSENPIYFTGEVEMRLMILDDLSTAISENTYTGECET